VAPADPNAATSPDIQALCQAATAGDVTALQRLLWLHHARFLGLVRSKLSAELAGKLEPDDILQEAYIEVFRSIRGFAYQGDDSFFHWAARIVEHRVIDNARHAQRKKRAADREVAIAADSSTGHEAFLDQYFHDSFTPSRQVGRADAIKLLMTCIAKLPEPHQTVVRRVHLSGEPFAAVATDLGRSENAVRHLSARAIERLHECLGEASRIFSSRD